jgi:hypothetical protein
VGLDAVRAFIEARGGSARIAFLGPEIDGCRPFEIELRLPAGARVGERRSDRPAAAA